MRRHTPLSTRTRWSIVAATLLAHPLLLYVLLPVFGESANVISALAPITATLLFNWRLGVVALTVNVFTTSAVFRAFTAMNAQEGIPKAVVSGFFIAGLCFAAEKLRLYIAQRRLIEEELQQAKKMEAIGRLAGGVAHDINNTLNSIMASVSAHRQELARIDGHYPDLDNIASACERGAQLTRNLLGFARKNRYQRETISLNEVIESVQALLVRTAGQGIRIAVRLDSDQPTIQGDRAQIESAVMNLCINALDAMATGGTLTMTTGRQARRVFLRVEDTGIGMDDCVKERVFEPFFTTKAPGKGTGLGLSMVYGIVHGMSGQIVLDTAPGQGTSITLLFPKSTTTARPAVPERSGSALTHLHELSGRTILVIDDNPLVLHTGMRLLRSMGCDVLSAKNGPEGVAAFTQRKGAVDLVIVDFMMSEMDGVAVIEALQRMNPSLPVILTSGHASESERVAALKDGNANVGFLAKPYRSEELLSVARELLRIDPASDAVPVAHRR